MRNKQPFLAVAEAMQDAGTSVSETRRLHARAMRVTAVTAAQLLQPCRAACKGDACPSLCDCGFGTKHISAKKQRGRGEAAGADRGCQGAERRRRRGGGGGLC